jgi:hypothetical protein
MGKHAGRALAALDAGCPHCKDVQGRAGVLANAARAAGIEYREAEAATLGKFASQVRTTYFPRILLLTEGDEAFEYTGARDVGTVAAWCRRQCAA